jgi:hypothetical protein
LRVLALLVSAGVCARGCIAALRPLPKFPIRPGPLAITAAAQAGRPFTVAGEHGAVLGEQSGVFEAWSFPVKILSRFGITAELADYPVPIDLSGLAAVIETSPAITTITYSHAAFTVKQRMFAPRDGAGAIVFFEIASARPLKLTFRFKPEMLRMWPAANFGSPDAEWTKDGCYILHTDNPAFSAAIGMPRTEPGILPPYQERPRTYPVEFKLSYDPRRDSGLIFPLLIAMGGARELSALNESIPKLYAETENYYAHFFDTRLTAETPDARFNQALRWAEIAIDQGRVRFHDETGLIAGYYESGDSARPGYAWFFGRDALWTSYAVNSYGDFPLTRQVLEFLIRRQRSDGKIMHEFSQTADLVDWKSTPYFYAAADSTPLFVMAMDDYVNASGDVEFLRSHWDAVRRAYAFTRAHVSGGIYDNSEGTGWVESWPPTMPHQEIYLAALDQQSAEAVSRLAGLMHDGELAAAAQEAQRIRGKIEAAYFEPGSGFYAFSRNARGGLDHTATIYPAVAWWSGRLNLPRADAMFNRWASPEFSTDWGTRDVSDRTPFYDPISYHQGSVWPLFTGWVSLAEYRAGRPLSGYAHLMQNADLTWAQDAGAVTELLSGEFFQPLGRSSSHQIWSSAMVLTPAIRGLFGVECDALNHVLRLAPNLPATWDRATLRNVPLGDARIDLDFTRVEGRLRVTARSSSRQDFCLAPREGECRAGAAHELDLPLPEVEVEIPHGLPLTGSQTAQLKVVGERRTAGRYELDLASPGDSEYQLPVRLNHTNVRVIGADLTSGALRVHFPPGADYHTVHVAFTW